MPVLVFSIHQCPIGTAELLYLLEGSLTLQLSRNDIAYLRRICGPRMTIQTVEVTDGALPLRMELEPNELRFVRIRKLN